MTSFQSWRFQDGREDIEDNERLGRRSTSTTDKNAEAAREMVMNNCRITIREVADDVGILFGSCLKFFECFGYEARGSIIYSKIVVNFEHKQRRMEVAQKSLTLHTLHCLFVNVCPEIIL